MTAPAVVIGAGPYGLSVAAHLRARGVPVRVFGEVMSSWRLHMPGGMCPQVDSLCVQLVYAVARLRACRFLQGPRNTAAYRYPGSAHRVVRQVTVSGSSSSLFLTSRTCRYAGLSGWAVDSAWSSATGGGCSPIRGDGERTEWLRPCPIPAPAAAGQRGLGPEGLVSHSSQHRDLSGFAGREVTVIGAGQSALESAALLHESRCQRAGCSPEGRCAGRPAPEASARRPARHAPRAEFPARPDLADLSVQPRTLHVPLHAGRRQDQAGAQVLGPLGAYWLRERVEGQLPVLQGHRVTGARAEGDKIVLTIASSTGSQELAVDHVFAATGYRVHLGRLDFLAPELRDQVRCVGGWPHLTGSFESSVPGLFFISLTAAETFGPVMRFVCGAGFAARRVTRAVAARVKEAKGGNAGADLGHPA